MRASRSIIATLALGLSALAAPAGGQDVASGKALFTQGLADMEAGHFEKGCPALEGSYKLDPRPGTLFTLAECENKRGRLATAVARYDDYLSMVARTTQAQQKKQEDRVKVAREQRAAIGPQVPMLTLTLPKDAPKGTVVKRDGIDLVDAALGVALPVDPGKHVVTTQAPGGEVTHLRVNVGKGEKTEISLRVRSPSTKPPAPTPEPAEPPPAGGPSRDEETAHGPSGRRVGAYVTGGVGVAGLVLGGVMGGLALGKKSDIKKNCNFPEDPKGCNDIGLEQVSTATTMGMVSTIGFAVGAAGAVTAVVLLLTEPKHTAGAARRLRVGVLSAGREGGTAGIDGVW